MRKQIDLTTLPGWANLSSGNHTIKIKAKGTGYRDSELSAGVVVSKAPSTVTLEAGTYKFVDSPTLPTPAITEDFSFMSSNTSFDKLIVNVNRRIVYSVEGDTLAVYYNNAWTDTSYQTITLATDQQVSSEFYKWAITDGNLVKQVEPAAYTDCLTFTGESSEFTLKPQYRKVWDGTLYYSTDHNTWNVWNGEEISSANKKLYLKGKGNTKFRIYDDNAEDFYYAEFRLSAKAECSGNIQTLLDWENPPTSIPADDCFNKMFFGCTNLTTAPELPAITLATHCYDSMFGNCTNLTTAPDLPATTLAGSCYSSMFLSCTSLTIAPELPATTLAQYCYSNMFRGCTNLITASALPATTLANYCYGYMFQGCTKLKVNTSSGNKIFTCPSSIPSMAVANMFSGTGGSFTGEPTAGNTYYWT